MVSTVLPRHSLKTRITLSTLLIFVVSLWSLSFYASQMLRRDIERLLGEQQTATATLLAAQINSEMQQHMLLATLILTILAGGLTWWSIKRQLAPLQDTAQAITEMSDTNHPTHSLPITQHDEIGQLIDSFNHLLGTFRQQDAALRDALHFQQDLMEAVPSPIFYKNEHCVYLGGNKAFERYFGLTAEQFVGKTVYDISPKDLAEKYDQADRALLSSSGAQTYEASVVYADGSRHDVVFNKATFTDAEGKIAGLIGVILDISERKQSEIELEKHRNHLGELVNIRTAELALARDIAETANIAKSAFLSNMSHEIRTPMNAIMGMSNILRRSGVSTEQAERLDKIDAAAQHLLGIISHILDLSKIEAGKFIMEEAPLNLADIVGNVCSMMSERARSKDIKLVVTLPNEPLRLRGDATRLQQALLNYITNALKFSTKGEVQIRALIQEDTADAVLVRFEVQDSGIGIAAEALPRIFQAFEQADNSSTREYGGTGLGLAIAKRLAEIMGGDAGVQSTQGVGSTFWFTARLKKEKDSDNYSDTTAHPTPFDDAEAFIRQRHKDRRVLLVEDELVGLAIAQYLLEDAGLKVDTAENGLQAVTMAQRTPYALIIMDIQMPVLNGIKATRLIRQLAEHVKTPILAMTANVFAEDKAACFEAGMDDFLIKPLEPNRLFASLLKWLDRE